MKAEAERRHAETIDLINLQNVTWKRQMADEAKARQEADARRSEQEARNLKFEAMRANQVHEQVASNQASQISQLEQKQNNF